MGRSEILTDLGPGTGTATSDFSLLPPVPTPVL